MDLKQLFREMCDAMTEYVGVGLAAPQVDLGIRFIVVEDRETGERFPFVNPQIVESSGERQIGPEGCLSFPGLWGEVMRHERVMVRYQDLDFVEHEEEFEGFFARVLQHEIDHLNGVLLIDRAEDGLHEAVSEDEAADEEAGEDETRSQPAEAPISPTEAP